jgi:hypothetical protein
MAKKKLFFLCPAIKIRLQLTPLQQLVMALSNAETPTKVVKKFYALPQRINDLI